MSQRKKIWYAPNRFDAYGKEEIDAVTKCLQEGWLTQGKYTAEFEKKMAKLFGKKYGLFVNSGSSACLLSLACLDLNKGSEVITPALGFATTVSPIIQLGLTPVFCDSGLDMFVPEVDDILKVVTPKTKAIMIPNLIGNKPDWKKLRELLPNMTLIEDSADTITYTKESDISTCSFYASHIITAGGGAGMIMTNNPEYLNRARMFRDWGRIGDNSERMEDRFNHSIDGMVYDYKFLYGVLGYNMKSCEMNAAFGLKQLERLDGFIRIRRENFERYLENLKDVEHILLPDDTIKPNWLAIPLVCNNINRLKLLTYLEKNNVQTRVCFAGNITRHPAFREYLQEFKNADRVMNDGFLLGCHQGMNIEDVDYVCNLLKKYISI